MTEGVSDIIWQAEASTAETKQLIRGIKRITLRKFTADEKLQDSFNSSRGDV